MMMMGDLNSGEKVSPLITTNMKLAVHLSSFLVVVVICGREFSEFGEEKLMQNEALQQRPEAPAIQEAKFGNSASSWSLFRGSQRSTIVSPKL